MNSSTKYVEFGLGKFWGANYVSKELDKVKFSVISL